MSNKSKSPKMAKILQLKPLTITQVTKYIGKVVGVIDISSIKAALKNQLPKPEAKIKQMYDYGNCLA